MVFIQPTKTESGKIKMANNKTQTNENEIAKQETAEYTPSVLLAQDTEQYALYQDEKGKWKRKAKYKEYSSVKIESREDKIWLANLLDNDEDTGNGLKKFVGQTIEVADIITRKYDSVDEDSRELSYGVLTYLITPDRTTYVTSSKSVYFSIENYLKMFGNPHEEGWENLQLLVKSKAGEKGDQITVKLVG